MSKWSRYTHMALKTAWATFTSSVGFDFVGRAPELDLMVKSIFVYLCLRLWTSWPLCRVGILSKINTKINHSVTGLKFSKFYFGKVKFFTPLEHEAYEEPQLSVSAQECDSFNATVSIFVKSCVCQLNIALKHFSYRTESPTGRLKREKTVSLINPEKYLLLQFHSNALAAVRRSTHYKSMLLMANCSKQRIAPPRTDVITGHKWSVTLLTG